MYVAEDERRRELALLAQCREFLADEGLWLLGERRALEQHAIDVLTQITRAPPLDATHLGVELALQRVLDRDEHGEVRPAQFSQQRCDNPGVGKYSRKLHHPAQVLLPEPAPVLRLQLLPRDGHDLGAILRAPLVEHLSADAVTDLPVECRERDVRRNRHLLACGFDHRAEVSHERGHLEPADVSRESLPRWGARQLSQRCCDFLRARLWLLRRAWRTPGLLARGHGSSSSDASDEVDVARERRFSMRRLLRRKSSLARESFRTRVGGSRSGSGGGVVVVMMT
jgi:hypothetical protein